MGKNVFKRLDTDSDLFQEALTFTTNKTGFNPALIEKDYFCSLILSYLFSIESSLIFKGGTALNKVHVGFYRLSEDLDFSISMPHSSTRSQRSKRIDPFRNLFSRLPKALPGIQTASPLTGRNNSLQYIGEIQYTSYVSAEPGTIQIEIGLREPNLCPVEIQSANTLLMDPVSGGSITNTIPVRVYARKEAYAEKLRAALSRRDPAIRDFFDIYHAVQKSVIELTNSELIELTHKKLAVPGNDFLGLTPQRIEMLKTQVETELRPVLRDEAYRDFDFEKCLSWVKALEKTLRSYK